MLHGKFADSNKGIKVLQWLGIMSLLGVVAILIFTFIPDTQSTVSLKILQGLQHLGVFILPPLCVAYLWSNHSLAWLYLTPHPNLRTTLCAVFLMIIALPGINLLADWNSRWHLPEALAPLEQIMQQMEQQAAVITERFLSTSTWGGLVVNLLLLAVLPAIGEEMTFRGVMQQLFTGKPSPTPHAAIWTTAILFSALHGQFYGFLPRMLIGAGFGYIFYWTGSLWTSVWMHFTNNALAVLAAFICSRNGWATDAIESIGTGGTLWLGFISIGMTLTGLFLFRRVSNE